jgi:hypothetical protein
MGHVSSVYSLPFLRRIDRTLTWTLDFHRRHAEKIVQVWSQRFRDAQPPRRLILIYLANGTEYETPHPRLGFASLPNNTIEVVQQSKRRGRDEFVVAFSPVSCMLLLARAQA